MPFKKNEDGTLVQDEKGFPIHIGADGQERPYDPDARAKQIAELTEKASRRGQELETLKAKYKALDEIEDLAAFLEKAKKDAETVASLADKERESEAAIQKRINEALKAAVTPLETERNTLKSELEKATQGLNQAIIGNAFANSKFAVEKLVNAQMARELFEGRFYVKDGKPVGRDTNGNDLFSSADIGVVASFDEALSRMVEASPFKENLLKPAPGGGGTSQHENSRPPAYTTDQIKNMSQEQFNKLRKEGRL